LLQESRGTAAELLQAAGAAEMVRFPLVFEMVFRRAGIDGHSANRIDRLRVFQNRGVRLACAAGSVMSVGVRRAVRFMGSM
jgi:hypothetical protein